MTTANERRLTDHEARSRLAQMPDAEKLADLFSLASFWRGSVFSPAYEAPAAVVDHVVPSPLGMECLEECCKASGVAKPDATLALFGMFSWLQPLIDTSACNVDGLLTLLSEDLGEDRIRLPYQWSRELGDRIQSRPDLAIHENIPHESVWQLLSDMPAGVLQLGRFVSGPLRIIPSLERRWYPPMETIYFHFMSDGERKARQLQFEKAEIPVNEAIVAIQRYLRDRLGHRSQWDGALAFFGMTCDTNLQRQYVDAPLVMAECLDAADKCALTAHLLKSRLGTGIRDHLRKCPAYTELAGMGSDALARKLPESVHVQLVFTLPTAQVVEEIDRSVADGVVVIPSTEVRLPQHTPPTPWRFFKTELGSLGLRPGYTDPAARLLRVVMEAYSSIDGLDDLRWHLGATADESIPTAMLNMLRAAGPADVVHKLVFASPAVARTACASVGLPLPAIAARNTTAINRFLWKCGFEMRTADTFADSIRDKTTSLEQFVENLDLSREINRDNVRSAANPLFVQLENFLDQLLSLNVWCTTQDHRHKTNFEYRLRLARRCVSTVLEPLYGRPTGAPPWNPERSSTLGTQLFYLSSFERFITTCKSKDRSETRRQNADKVVDHLDRRLAFPHVQLWADATPASLDSYEKHLLDFGQLLRQGDVAGVRNGLDHWRESHEFPTREQITNCCKKLNLAIRLAEEQHLLPVLYWLDNKVKHVHLGFSEYSCRSATRARTIIRPSTLAGMPEVPMQKPIVFSPLQISDAADVAIFFFAPQESSYADYWSDFPRYAAQDPRRLAAESTEAVFSMSSQAGSDASRQDTTTDRILDEA